MKILFLSNLYPPNVVGGYERLCFQVADALRRRGHEISVLTSNFGDRVENIPGQTVFRSLRLLANRKDIYAPFEADAAERANISVHNERELLRTVAEVRPDLIFVWNLFFLDRGLQQALARLSPPSVFFLTDNWLIAAETPDRIGAFFDAHVRGDQPFAGTERAIDHAMPQIGVFGSGFVRELYHHCGFSFSKEIVVHNGVTAPELEADGLKDRTALAHPGELRLLFAGRLVELKGPQTCVAALPRIQGALGSSIKVKLTVVGDRTDATFAAALDQAIAASGMSDAIEVRGAVPEQDLPDLFAEHDIYLFPSFYEPFALTLILAMASGIPVVASDVGGNPEIVFDGRTGLLFPKGDAAAMAAAVVELANNPELRGRLGERGCRFARRFSFSRMVVRLEQELLELASGVTA